MDHLELLEAIIKLTLSLSERATEGPWSTTPCKGEGWEHHKLVNGYQRAVKHRDFIRAADADLIAEYRLLCPAFAMCLGDALHIIRGANVDPGKMEWFEQRIQGHFKHKEVTQ